MKQRVFLAFPIPGAIRDYLGSVADRLADGLAVDEVVRWVRPEGMHITAHFLGDQDAEAVRRIGQAAEAATRYPAVRARLDQVGWFPPEGPPRVIVAGVVEEAGRKLIELQGDLGRVLEREGVAVDRRPWMPHVTLGRVKTAVAAEKIAVAIEQRAFIVDRLALYRSDRTEDGARYVPLGTYPLSA